MILTRAVSAKYRLEWLAEILVFQVILNLRSVTIFSSTFDRNDELEIIDYLLKYF